MLFDFSILQSYYPDHRSQRLRDDTIHAESWLIEIKKTIMFIQSISGTVGCHPKC